MDNEELLTPEQVAAELRVSVRTIRAWRSDGRLKYVKLGHRIVRISRAQLNDFLAQSARGPEWS